MQTYNVRLESPIFKSYRCKRAADSLDIDVEKKSVHQLKINADLISHYNIGLIIGASGSGKTTLAKEIFGQNCFESSLDPERPVIEQFPNEMDYESCASALSGIGLNSVPCWIRPVKTLSNGQRSRAEAALLMINQKEVSVIDEWTSVVDRNVAKAMSYCVQKYARKQNKKIVLLSCHYDVLEWLNPDWVIDCNLQSYTDRRSLWRDFKRSEQLQFDIKWASRKSWQYFSKYHYLSENLPGGDIKIFGLFNGPNQIGFQCYANYVPHSDKKAPKIMHMNRTVIHPDYTGLSLGIRLIDETAKIMKKMGHRVMAKYSSIPVFISMSRSKSWRLLDVKRQFGKIDLGKSLFRRSGFRENIKTYHFEFVG